ncbi:MAG TPA: hypothetical protein VNV41_16415 [Candidatus Acidoferrales bacterium]|jgi:hypothetical protein|nr:hypothetical protein [Candidatus Acidoferrales bacterium]
MSDVSKSTLGETLNADLAAKIAAAPSAEAITALLHEEAQRQGRYTPDALNPSVLVPTSAAESAPAKFARAVTVAGEKKIFEADSELQLEKDVNAYFKSLESNTAARTETRQEQTAAAKQHLVEQEQEEFERAELELQFKRGEIDTATYLAKSGAIEQHLADLGIDVTALQDATKQKFVQSWEQATNEFLQNNGWWPGGEANQEAIGKVLIEMGAVDAPNAENIRRAAEYLRDNNLLVANPEAEAYEKMRKATTAQEIHDAASSLFGR